MMFAGFECPLTAVEQADKAIRLAALWHHGQRDKGGHPYIMHPLRVGLAFGQFNAQLQTIGFLHDVIEDCNIPAQRLLDEGFSPAVVNAVVALSRREGESYKDYMERCVQNGAARLVKREDIKDNMLRWRWPEMPDSMMQRYQKWLDFVEGR